MLSPEVYTAVYRSTSIQSSCYVSTLLSVMETLHMYKRHLVMLENLGSPKNKEERGGYPPSLLSRPVRQTLRRRILRFEDTIGRLVKDHAVVHNLKSSEMRLSVDVSAQFADDGDGSVCELGTEHQRVRHNADRSTVAADDDFLNGFVEHVYVTLNQLIKTQSTETALVDNATLRDDHVVVLILHKTIDDLVSIGADDAMGNWQ